MKSGSTTEPDRTLSCAVHAGNTARQHRNVGVLTSWARAHPEEEHDHAHDSDISAISIREERPLDRGKFIKWLTELGAMEGGDLLRYKGILSFEGIANRSILQGVHMIKELEDAGPWPDGVPPATELVFIGRRLMDDVIREGVRNCVAR